MFAEEKSFTEAATALGIERSKVQRNVEGLKRRLADRLAEAA
jgi:DNA-binding transcriptional LysR family regulator